ncbi:unnamed protein product [Peniophora sp. CBMAI 1063]|nr:unnamed protein product [Peniophora sp. CBMAI 1063]
MANIMNPSPGRIDYMQNAFPRHRPLPRPPPNTQQQQSQPPPDETSTEQPPPDTQQQQQQFDQSSFATASQESRAASEMSFHWHTNSGQFRHPMGPPPTENGSYDWSNLGHPERNPFSVKLPLPPPFMDKEADVEAYITRVSFFIQLHMVRFRTNADQVYFFLQGCSGPESLLWAAQIMKAHLDERECWERFPEYATITQVVKLFRLRFGVLDKQRAAQAKFEALKQGSQPVRSYIAMFDRLEQDAGYNDAALVQAFRRGLDRVLRKKIDDMAEPPRTIRGWKEVTLDDKDAHHRAAQEEDKVWTHKPAQLSGTCAEGSSSSQAPARVQAAFTRLTKEERADLGRRGGCFYCRKTGHRFFECPERPEGKGKEKEKEQVGVFAMLIAQLKDMGKEERAQELEALKDF